MPSSRGSSQPRDQTPVSHIAGRFTEPPGKSKNTGMSSLSLLQETFLFQESNQGHLHCRWILYRLSHQGSPRILEWVAMSSSRGSSQPRAPASQGSSLPSEPPGKPKNTGVGRLSLLQGIFLIQELNWGLLHFRRIPYQLSYVGSPQCDGVE